MQLFRSVPVGSSHLPRHRVLMRVLVAFAMLAAMMALAACGGGAEAPGAEPGAEAPTGPAEEVVVEMTDQNRFVPEHVEVPVGGTIVWRNTGSIPHTVTDDPAMAMDPSHAVLPEGAEPWDSGNINGGDEFSHTFEVAGDYSYFCKPHEAAGMVGTITVTP